MRILAIVVAMIILIVGCAAAGPADEALWGLPGYKEAARWPYEQELMRQRIERMSLRMN
jgi:hypothetical protein